jgi:hypothetical protein
LLYVGQFQRIQLAQTWLFISKHWNIFMAGNKWWFGPKNFGSRLNSKISSNSGQIFWALIWIFNWLVLALLQASNFQILLRPILYLAD